MNKHYLFKNSFLSIRSVHSAQKERGINMSLNEALKFFRVQRNLTQSELADTDRSTYSRIENNKAKVLVNQLKPFSDKLSITVSELLLFSGLDNDFYDFQRIIKEASIHPQKPSLKRKILAIYKELQPNKCKNNKQLAMYYCVIASFSRIYNEIEPPSKNEVQYSFRHLIKLTFHTQYDYLLALNMISYYTSDQVKSITKTMFPIKEPHKRTVETLKYANILMVNAITMQVYNLNYDYVIKFCTNLEKEALLYENHYYRFLMKYYKYLSLHLENFDNESLRLANKYLDIIQDMYDADTYNSFKIEQENLIHNPRYYLDLNIFEITNIKD